MTKFKIGQKLFQVEDRPGNKWPPRTSQFVIGKIGRKWLTDAYGERVDMESLQVDGGHYSSPAQCYLSENEYWDKKAMGEIWRNIQGQFLYKPPNITLLEMIKIAKVWGVSIKQG